MEDISIKLGNVKKAVERNQIRKENKLRIIPEVIKNVKTTTIFLRDILNPITEDSGDYSKEYGFTTELTLSEWNQMIEKTISDNKQFFSDNNIDLNIFKIPNDIIKEADILFNIAVKNPKERTKAEINKFSRFSGFINSMQNSFRVIAKQVKELDNNIIAFGYRTEKMNNSLAVKYYENKPVSEE